MLTIDNISKTYGLDDDRKSTVKALEDIDMTIEEGEFVSIIGPTGCGKSTLFEIIGGLINPTTGELRLEDKPVTEPHPRIGMVFQDHSTFPWLTVIENVEFGVRMNGMDETERRRRAQEMLDLVGLSGFEDTYPNELSGGMNQRVAIARTLVMDPDVLLMDEPFGALDEQTRLILGEELLRIWRETGSTILFVTHNINEAVQLSDRIAVMSARPGRFKAIVENEIPRPRDDDTMSTDAFNDLVQQLWDELKEESRRGLEQKEYGDDGSERSEDSASKKDQSSEVDSTI
ncbi:ABC transporter ATP-binding protein [Halalkalicoccus subterraneus]|uniref:ABC transporter ATP-binding protein n=1 Tax=Halalkalicoccus subterraneus TaxID=2675002 RepID=UPI001B85BB04|nr:ABC transporter ATP-binding protein [Halalkalicoccus subterraneus]